MSDVDDFVSVLLQARSVAHVEHWSTESYAQHMALGEFYEGLSDLMDTFVEQYQGYYEKRISPKVRGADTDEDIMDVLTRQVEWIERNRYGVCDKDETALQNVIDEIVGLYQSTLYKLRFLK